jgi:3-hydroxyisobutyrate dehydrogenase
VTAQRPPVSGPRRLGLVGLGTMGLGMAMRLLDLGFELVVYNRTLGRAQPLAARGATLAATAAALAGQAEIVLVSVADETAVEAVLFGPEGVARGLQPGGVVIDTSTVAPAFARSVAERLAASGHHAVDACVLGNAQHARDGDLRVMVGGPDEVVTRVRPLLEALAKEVLHLGQSGRGATAKLMLNMLMGIELQALAEAVVFGVRAGLPRDLVLKMISHSGFSSPVMRFKCGVIERAAFDRAEFRLTLMHKDMALVSAEGRGMGIDLRAADIARATLAEAVSQGLGDLDCAAVLLHLERQADRQGTAAPAPGAAPPEGAVTDTTETPGIGSPRSAGGWPGEVVR